MKKNNKNDYVISLDLGSTNFKAALFDSALNRIIEKAMPLKYLKSRKKNIEFDGEKAWETVKKLVIHIIDAGNIRKDHKVTISVCSQANTFSILRKDGNLKIPFISWLDGRAVDESKILNKMFDKVLPLLTGHNAIIPYSTLSKILWIRKNKPGLILNGDIIIPFSSYIMYKLTGSIYFDKNIATMDGMYSIREDRVWSGSFDLLEIDIKQIPELVEVGHPLGVKKVAGEISEKAEIQFLFAGNDQTAAAIGNFLKNDTILISLGTAISFYRHRDGMGPYGKESFWGKYPFNGYYEIFASSFGTKVLDKVIEKYFPGETLKDFTGYAKSQKEQIGSSDGLFFYPGLVNHKFPWSGDSNIRVKALSTFEGFGFYIRFVLKNFLNINSPDKYKIHITGGGSANDLWLQLIANILNSEIIRSKGDTLLGAARIVLGRDLESEKATGDTFYPIKSEARIYNEIYHSWIKGLEKTKNLF